MPENIRTIIIDDEKLAREIIKKYIKDFPEIILLDECSNGLDGIKKINELKPDLVFLDVQMPKITGFEMLEVLEYHPVIIFTTAFDQYALKAFEVNAADYLLKPFSNQRFMDAVQKAKLHLKQIDGVEKQITQLIEDNRKNTEIIERIIVKNNSKISIIPVNEIVYFEAQDDYVMIYTADQKQLKQQTLKYFEEHLDTKSFIRIHRSYIVNINCIKNIELVEKTQYYVKLKNGEMLPVSKSGYDKLKESFN